jgi:hypothetical protein
VYYGLKTKLNSVDATSLTGYLQMHCNDRTKRTDQDCLVQLSDFKYIMENLHQNVPRLFAEIVKDCEERFNLKLNSRTEPLKAAIIFIDRQNKDIFE